METNKLKKVKSISQIAKKHRVNISTIERQLKIGEPIEHEHTKDHKLAKSIALQHLDEFPDYYTKLKKMEKSIPEQNEIIRYCPKCEKNETRSECSYGPKYWDLFSLPARLGKKYDPNKPHPTNEEKDHEYSMARSEISKIISAAKRLKKKIGKGEGNIEAWVQSKITRAADYIDTAADYLDSGEHKVNEAKSFEITSRRPKKIKTMTKSDAERHSENAAKLHQKARASVSLPKLNNESTTIEDANGNSFLELVDVVGPQHIKPIIKNNNWVGNTQNITEHKNKTFFQFMEAIDKSKMKCNSPKADSVGDSQTGKSHVVKACEGGKEKIIRFGQRGVKGSPKKEGESEAYANRRKRFKARHSKNIAKGKMSAAYWADKVKW